jgi:hypothetical protein
MVAGRDQGYTGDATAASTQRFLRETLIVAGSRTNIPAARLGQANGLPYFVMPYVAGDAAGVGSMSTARCR